MSYTNVFIIADTEANLKELSCGASTLGSKFSTVIFDEQLQSVAASYGPEKIYHFQAPESGIIEDNARVIADMVQAASPEMVLLSNTTRGRLLAGKIGAYLDTCVIAGVTELTEEGTKRMVYGGAAFRTQKATAQTAVVTCNAGVFEVSEGQASGDAAVEAGSAASDVKIKKIETQPKEGVSSNIAIAKKVVDMGRGFKEEKDVEMCRELASLLGAELGCSRPVAENNGWLPKSVYIGVTGIILKPEMIVSLCISGQVQHMVGINQAKKIIAINKDERAPIFASCDLGLVGDVYQILPMLIEKLK
ncbi:electron transfer flavoprotein subunit alpha [Pseudodesulfovibrio sp. JC047]|uniref:electron transfer flavoprotein subunit alpha/FixB family protein n=1 Tax=Pseudodesulfovibrio sp. JC047 TaxID=2683199 RepID=UPI0013D0A860|nr:electron transfer flavoprotein subunit alpha/FixB family protein [Pseudodesulfovibrio sp. JC047]NDV18803.1 electron transfer flavoprotein subunit alpha [Pseudodesulfovibrio sp. JC047]